MRTTFAAALALACLSTVDATFINTMTATEFRDKRAGFTNEAQKGRSAQTSTQQPTSSRQTSTSSR
jgi:hypothetical protein